MRQMNKADDGKRGETAWPITSSMPLSGPDGSPHFATCWKERCPKTWKEEYFCEKSLTKEQSLWTTSILTHYLSVFVDLCMFNASEI